MDSMPSKQVQILIKSSSPRVKDFSLFFDIGATVDSLKQYLSLHYPNNPPASLQKLIFAGKLLQNNMILEEVFKQRDISIIQTVHIVISPSFSQVNSTCTNSSTSTSMSSFSPDETRGVTGFQENIRPEMRRNHFRTQINDPQRLEFGSRQQQQQQFLPQHPQPVFANPYGFRRLPQPQQPQQQQQHGERENAQIQEHVERTDIWFLLKLVVLVYVFSQGGGLLRSFLLCFAALILYLYQSGIFRIDARIYSYPGNVPQNTREIPLERNQTGTFNALATLMLPFFYSLLPSWHVQPTSSPPQFQQPPEQQPQPQPQQQSQSQPQSQSQSQQHRIEEPNLNA